MSKTVRNLIIIALILLVGAEALYYSRQISAKNAVIAKLDSQLKAKDIQYIAELAELNNRYKENEIKYKAQVVELDFYKFKWQQQNAHSADREKNILEFIDSLPKIETLTELVEVSYPNMDGAVSEGYGYRLAALTEKEGIEKLVSILSTKDIGTIDPVSYLLFSEYFIQNNPKKVQQWIEELEAIDLANADDKKKAVVFCLLKAGYSTRESLKSGV